MAKRSQAEKVYDRMSADLPINSVVSVAIVADPYSTVGERIQVLRSIRDDPVAGMHARGQVDDAQLAAAREWQRFYEGSEVGSIRAIDPAKEAVDGGRMQDPISDRQIRASAEMAKADKRLGYDGKMLVMDILGRRLSIREAAERRGEFTRSGWEYTGRRFRECLESLAVLWGFAMKG